MTANQRRSGFRLPWSSEADDSAQTEEQAGAGEPAAPEPAGPQSAASGTAPMPGSQPPNAAGDAGSSNGTTPTMPEADAARAPTAPAPAAPNATAERTSEGSSEPPPEFLRELITAMRKVADDARQGGIEQLRSQAEDAIRAIESDAEKRRGDLRARAEADIAGVGEWARAEAERIKSEAEQRVASRREQLEQQLAADETRTEAGTKALRARVADYERELEAYHAQLSAITDPAAFAAAAKRMPHPPSLVPHAEAPAEAPSEPAPTSPATPVDPAVTQPTPSQPAGTPSAESTAPPATTASPAEPIVPTDEVHPAEEEVLASRLAELDAKLDAAPAASTPEAVGAPAAASVESVTTDVVVKGLGSFGAITGFRQSLASQEGISGVALSLGQTGEFVFRATHANGVDVAAAITAIEGEGVKIEQRPEGGLRVTLERAR
jgi:hypothetical protein